MRAQKRINLLLHLHFPIWISAKRPSRGLTQSHSASLWILGFTALLSLSYYSGSVEAVPAPGKIAAAINEQAKNEIEQSQNIIRSGDGGDGSDLETAQRNSDATKIDDGYVREPRAVAYMQRIDKDKDSIRHYDKIPTSRMRLDIRPRKGTTPPPEDDEDDFESLEANREAFIEILNEHAKYPHRRRSLKHHHNSKMQLTYDPENKRYSITEQQSEEW